MKQRRKIILDVIIEWAIEQRTNYDARFSNPEFLALEKSAKEHADKAFLAAAAAEVWNDPEGLLDEFYSAAKDYFLLNLHQRSYITQNTLAERKKLQDLWENFSRSVQTSNSNAEISNLLSSSSLTDREDWLSDLLADQKYMEHDEFKGAVIAAIEEAARDNVDAMFGEAMVYESVGRDLAWLHFAKRHPKINIKSKAGKDIDIFRATHIAHIVEESNLRLVRNETKAATPAEVGRILLSQNYSSLTAEEQAALKWAIEEGFQASMIGIEAFMNSISAGKRTLKSAQDSE